MLKLLKEEMNKTKTLNGAATYATSRNYCLDLFASIGSLRNQSEREILKRFHRAFCEDKNLAMKILFFARDIRGGLGERRVFRTILKNMPKESKNALIKNIENVAEYGRYDDLLVLLDTSFKKEVVKIIREQLKKDLENAEGGNVSLLAKWLPSINASNIQTVRAAKKLCACLKMSERKYRKTLSKLREKIKITENYLREKDYSFDYSHQPSKAIFKYKKAFLRNDKERYEEFIKQVQSGKAKMNTGTLYPYEVIRPLYGNRLSDDEIKAIDVTWNNLPDYTKDENALVVSDGSGSMYCCSNPVPASVAQSLAIYFAERNKGKFKNHFITFSENPQLVEIKGENIAEKVKYCASFNEVASTNIQKVFEVILKTAVKNKVPENEMPETIYIISDMEFNYCTIDSSLTNFEYAKKIFKKAGYKLPKIIFWNVDSKSTQFPVEENEQGVALVSGASPEIFKMTMSGDASPYKFMLNVLNSKRYEKITA